MVDKTKPISAGMPADLNVISVNLSISPDRLHAAMSALLSIGGSAGITVRGGTAEVEKAIKSITSGDLEVLSALLRVVGKEPKLG